jgi:hypothetical protein
MSGFNLGNGLAEARSYDAYRQQPTGVTLGTATSPSSLLNLGLAYCAPFPPPASCTNNNGNLQSQTIAPLEAVQTYGYDAFNRVNWSQETRRPYPRKVLLATGVGARMRAGLFHEEETLHAPHLLDLEIVHVLRRG